MNSKLKSFFVGAKKANSAKSEQDKLEAEQLLTRVRRLGLIDETQGADTILGLQLSNIMERRLQTIVLKKGLARTAKQARQFITHEHILIGNKKITSPSYLVTLEEEGLITFDPKSAFNDPMHPERAKAEDEDAKKLKEIKKKEEKVEEKQPEKEEKAAPEAATA
jgi:small subunit ribosomal protein S4